jgi:hypothetical protein
LSAEAPKAHAKRTLFRNPAPFRRAAKIAHVHLNVRKKFHDDEGDKTKSPSGENPFFAALDC